MFLKIRVSSVRSLPFPDEMGRNSGFENGFGPDPLVGAPGYQSIRFGAKDKGSGLFRCVLALE